MSAAAGTAEGQKPASATLKERFAQHVIAAHQFRGQDTLTIKREGLTEIARSLKDELAFDFLMDLSCVDYLRFGRVRANAPTLQTPSPLPFYMKPRAVGDAWSRGVSNDEYRFEVVYHFYSSLSNARLRLKVPVKAADATVPTLTTLWKTANWFEREVWDMFGIRFDGHPNLKRILMYEEFKGHPLRKDYPINKRQPLIGPAN